MNYRGKALGSFRVLIEPPLPGEVKTSLRKPTKGRLRRREGKRGAWVVSWYRAGSKSERPVCFRRLSLPMGKVI